MTSQNFYYLIRLKILKPVASIQFIIITHKIKFNFSHPTSYFMEYHAPKLESFNNLQSHSKKKLFKYQYLAIK